MADLEKVIKGLELCSLLERCAKEKCPYYEVDDCFDRMHKDALELLKAQEPVKPIVSGNGKDFESASTWWYSCGNCQVAINPNDKFCHECGRKVLWDG